MFKSMKLGVKLLCSFGVVALVVLLLGLVGYYGATRSDKFINEIGGVRLPSVENLLIIKEKGENIRGSMRTLAIPGLSREVRENMYHNLLKAREKYQAAWKTYEALPQTPEEAQIWKEFVSTWDAWREANNQAMELSKKLEGLNTEDKETLDRSYRQLQDLLLGRVAEKEKAALGLLDKLVEVNKEAAVIAVKQAAGEAAFLKVLSLVAMLIGLALAMGLGVFITTESLQDHHQYRLLPERWFRTGSRRGHPGVFGQPVLGRGVERAGRLLGGDLLLPRGDGFHDPAPTPTTPARPTP